MFFADKAILIEGDTERILLPAMMNKIDIEDPSEFPLLSQNISIVEVGAYAHIFEKFIDFIGIKSLLITDIDSCDSNNEACRAEDIDAVRSTNASIKSLLPTKTFEELRNSKQNIELDGEMLSVAFQHKQDGYHARSFEDAFIHINQSFITSNKKKFNGLKNAKYFDLEGEDKKDAYDLAKDCIKKKHILLWM